MGKSGLKSIFLDRKRIIHFIADVAELVDAHASGACGSNPVRVRVSPSAPESIFFKDRFRMQVSHMERREACGERGAERRVESKSLHRHQNQYSSKTGLECKYLIWRDEKPVVSEERSDESNPSLSIGTT